MMESHAQSPQNAYARLREAMAPDPSRWYYTGKCEDAGEYGESHCACGHEIRYEFIIACEDDARTLIIGSTCIEKNVPALIEHGYDRLATELTDARLKLKRDLAAERRDLQAEEAIADLHADYRRLRNWCFARRDEWPEMYPHRRRPEVFHWIKQRPEGAETPSREAAAIRQRYVSMWLKASQAVAVDWHDRPPSMPLPQQERLLAQLSRALERALENGRARNHEGAAYAIETCEGLQPDATSG